MSDFLSPSEAQFRRRVRDLEAGTHDVRQHLDGLYGVVIALHADNRRLRRAVRTLARLQPERVSAAVLGVLNDA